MKRHTTITLEEDLHEALRSRGINISMICEDACKNVLNSFQKTINPSTCKHNYGWPFCTAQGLVKECKKCGELKRVRMETYEETMRGIKNG